ncbi:MAG: hypothetical protein K8W52_06745 [Deltaproteobacteria bacterium]|nr:hypothetical protein [Deltaproteobacteria bacterium]
MIALVVAGCASSKLGADASPPDADPPDAMVDGCVPVTETCNTRDDNCNGKVDEDFPTLGDGCVEGLGSCQVTGTLVCKADGTGVECSAHAGDGSAERCDAIDNDCDGKTDEDFTLGQPCDGLDADQCNEGAIVCDATGGQICGDMTGDSIEICNAVDDDCDGNTDEGFGVGQTCDGLDGDLCKEGTIACDGTGAAICTDGSTTNVETCNGLDDDCQNGVDDGFALGVACSIGVGACATPGMTICSADGTGTACNATAGAPTAELCGDGIDQDCNGSDVACPTNDGPTGAIDVSAGGTWTVDLTAAHDDAVGSCSSGGGRDVFYTFTLPAAEVVYVDAYGSNFDTALTIFAGTCAARGAQQVCNDDSCSLPQSQAALQLAAGTYCIVADQYSSSQTAGALVLNVTRGRRTGFSIAAANGTQTANSCDAAHSNQATSGCQSSTAAKDVGYFFLTCPNTTKTVGANTCTGTTWDSVVYLRHGSANTGDVACNDDSCGLESSFTGATIATAGLNWLIVDGYSLASTTCGAYTLTYTIQ